MTVRDRIKAIQVSLRDGMATPDVTRTSLMLLTGLLGNCVEESRKSDLDYKRILAECRAAQKSAAAARIDAESSPQYARAREAKDVELMVLEMIRSCRAYLRSVDEEMRLSR